MRKSKQYNGLIRLSLSDIANNVYDDVFTLFVFSALCRFG